MKNKNKNNSKMDTKIKIDLNHCLARRNQSSLYNQQCPHLKKNGHYCGKHKNYLKNKLIPINDNETENKKEYYKNRFKEFEKIEQKKNSNKKTKKKNNYSINFKELESISKKTLNIIDYLFNEELNFSDKFIKKSFKYYKLDQYLSKKNKLNTDNMKKTLSNLFKTTISSYINIDKIVVLQNKIKKWNKTSKFKDNGPAVFNRSLCVNETDFYNLDSLTIIENKYFFSFKDIDNFIYGFHIESFINLISNNPKITNPYNRQIINKDIKNKAIIIWQKLNKKKETSNYINNKNNIKDIKTKVKNKSLAVLQKIDLFGYQTNLEWLMQLTPIRIRSLYRQIKNYWNYKAGLTEDVKNRIVPNMNPFHNVNTSKLNNSNKFVILEVVVDLIDIIISSGLTEDDKNQGCIIILFALNEINRDCGRSNPWLI